MIHVGIDILELRRLRAAHYPERISEYVLTDGERQEMRTQPDQLQFLASRIAAKEAVIKACPDRLTWQDFAIVKDGLKPSVRFIKKPNQSIQKPGRAYELSVSLSHSTDYVAGFACCTVL